MKPTRVLFLLPYPLNTAPSQRFRMEAFFSLLKQKDFDLTTQAFFNLEAWNVLYRKGSFLAKTKAVVLGFARRLLFVCFRVSRYDIVVIHREASPLGPPVFEWMIAKVWRKRIIYDFDDAIWIPAASEDNELAMRLKCHWKVGRISRWAHKVSVGNEFLARFAQQYNEDVSVIPTVVDTKCRYSSLVKHTVEKPTIGWTGSHSTLKYLETVLPVLKQLEKQFDFEFIVICNKKPEFELGSLRYIQWNEKTEIEDLKRIQIGLMPLEADAWSEGKCGFKIIQYLALGIPAVASPVGVNKKIINDENGFLCYSDKDWYEALNVLLLDTLLREKMGRRGREKIVQEYSIHAVASSFLELFEPAAASLRE